MSASTSMSVRRIAAALLYAAVAAFAAAACGPEEVVVNYCDKKCDCERCRESQIEVCEIRYEGYVDMYSEYECDDEYLDYLDCVRKKGTCDTDANTFGLVMDCVQDPVTLEYICTGPCDSKYEKVEKCYQKGSKNDNLDEHRVIDW